MTDSPEMPTGNAQEPEQDAAARQARYQAILERLTLMSDLFARNVLKDKACAEYILQVIMEDSSLRIVSLDIQADLKNLYGRSATLDCIAQDAAGKLYNIEIQQEPEGASPFRARYYSALLDMNTLDPGDRFNQLPESYVIFITEDDIFNNGLPICHIDRIIRETGIDFGDLSKIIYVTASIQEDTELGSLMHDFHCRDAADMHSAVLAGRVRELKETQKGVSYMCSELRMLREEGISIGLEKGKLIMLYDLVRDGTLPLSAAAARARQDDSEFQAGMERYFASAG